MSSPVQRRVSLTSLSFHRFKALDNFSISLRDMNILVGPNNCGKSTIIGALRSLAVAIRSARVRRPEFVRIDGSDTRAYRIQDDLIPISLENVHTDYREEASWVNFRFSNENILQLRFPASGGCLLVPQPIGRPITTAAQFKKEFPVSIVAVPVLGPVEHHEGFVEKATVQRGIETHRAPRHFRSYWYYFDEQFDDFSELVEKTWPGMGIEELSVDWDSKSINLFCRDGRISRELYWSGFGFQVWCQLLTHILRATDADLIIVDEPEIYLHPDVQRQLLEILRRIKADVVLATHSSEIIGDADPSEILLIDKRRKSATRLKGVNDVQGALETVGSVHNVTLAAIARSGRVLFVEQDSDFKLIRLLAGRGGFSELSAGTGITAVPTGGFSNWDNVRGTGWGLARVFGSEVRLGCILDRDFRSPEENAAIEEELGKYVSFVRILGRKEIENFLLDPLVITRAINREVKDRARLASRAAYEVTDLSPVFFALTDEMESDVFGQYIGHATKYLRDRGEDPGTTATRLHSDLSSRWSTLEGRLSLCPGKRVLKAMREYAQREHLVSLTESRIVSAMNRSELPKDLQRLLEDLERFRVLGGDSARGAKDG